MGFQLVALEYHTLALPSQTHDSHPNIVDQIICYFKKVKIVPKNIIARLIITTTEMNVHLKCSKLVTCNYLKQPIFLHCVLRIPSHCRSFHHKTKGADTAVLVITGLISGPM